MDSLAWYDQWKLRATDDEGPTTPLRPTVASAPIRCLACNGLFDVAGHSPSAEAGEYVCNVCSWKMGECGAGRLCPECEGPLEFGTPCPQCWAEKYGEVPERPFPEADEDKF